MLIQPCGIPKYNHHFGWNVNTLRHRKNGCHFADNIFKCILMYGNHCILIKITSKFTPKGPNDINSALVQVMNWRCTSDKPLPEPVMIDPDHWHIYASQLQWVNYYQGNCGLVTPYGDTPGSTLTQVMTRHLSAPKPLAGSMLNYCELDPWELQWNLNQNIKLSRKCILKCLQNASHIFSGLSVLIATGVSVSAMFIYIQQKDHLHAIENQQLNIIHNHVHKHNFINQQRNFSFH